MSEFFDHLKISILGSKSTNIDKDIDNSLTSIENYASSSSTNKYLETMKKMVSKSGADNFNSSISELKGQNQIEVYEQSGRTKRYAEYDALVHKISYCQRALSTLTDNIISPDDITKRTLLFVSDEEKRENENIKNVLSRLRKIEDKMNFENKINDIVKRTLKKGDYFLEILHSPKGENALTILNENSDSAVLSFDPQKINELAKIDTTIEFVKESDNQTTETKDISIVLETSSFGSVFSGLPVQTYGANINKATGQAITNKTFKSTNNSSKPEFQSKFSGDSEQPILDETQCELKNLFIATHQPQYVIRLETERFKTCLGYLVFPKVDAKNPMMSPYNNGSINTVDSICADIVTKIKNSLNSTDKINISDDMKNVLLMHIDKIQNNEDLKIRYVPPELMVHWRINVDKYDPYGESIFECVNYDARLLVALKTATTIKKLTSASDKRIMYIESGLPRDVQNLIEVMKESINKKKVSIDSMGSIDTIPSQIQTFETIYIPQRDGKRFVEFDQQQWGPQPQQDTEELKFIRDQIVANLGVPAPFLGLEENTCLTSHTKIPLLEGFSVSIGTLVEEYNKDPEKFNQWTYSIDPETNKVVPGKIIKAMHTRKNADLVRVHLDNDKYIDCTPDHRFMLRDGSYKEAQYLEPKESLMPWYIRNSSVKTKNNCPYTQVYHPGTRRWAMVHRVVSESLNILKHGDRKHCHHVDEDPRNNHPSNLKALTAKEHLEAHADKKYVPNRSSTYSIKEKRNCVICNKEFECRIQKNQTTCLSKECMTERKRRDGHKFWERKKRICGDDYVMVKHTCPICSTEFEIYKKHLEERGEKWATCGNYECGRKITGKKNTYRVYGENETVTKTCCICNEEYTKDVRKEDTTNTCSITCMNTVLARRRHSGNRKEQPCSFCGDTITTTEYERKNNRYIPCSKKSCKSLKQGVELWLKNNPEKTIDDYIDSKELVMNHKVVRVEWLSEKEDCCDIEIENYHNFATEAGVFVHNSNRSLLTVENINFARTIISFQKELSIPLKETFEKIYALLYPKDVDLLNDIKVTFQEPKVSPYEHQMEYVTQVQSLIEALKQWGVPVEWSKKKYLPDFPWDEIEKTKAEEKLNIESGESESTDDAGGFGGYGGGY